MLLTPIAHQVNVSAAISIDFTRQISSSEALEIESKVIALINDQMALFAYVEQKDELSDPVVHGVVLKLEQV